MTASQLSALLLESMCQLWLDGSPKHEDIEKVVDTFREHGSQLLPKDPLETWVYTGDALCNFMHAAMKEVFETLAKTLDPGIAQNHAKEIVVSFDEKYAKHFSEICAKFVNSRGYSPRTLN